MHFDASTERMRQQNTAILMADYERKRFNLEPRGPNETDKEFCERIDREKTRKMFQSPERIPGSDDDYE